MVAFYSINIRSHLKFFVDSMGAISNAQTIRDQIPRRRLPNNADLLSTLRKLLIFCVTIESYMSKATRTMTFPSTSSLSQRNSMCFATSWPVLNSPTNMKP